MDLIERFLVGLILGAAWEQCLKNCHLVQDPLLWNYDLATQHVFQRWPITDN